MSKHPSKRPPIPPTSPPSRPPQQQQQPPRSWQLPPYRLILLGNGSSDLMDIIRAIMDLTRLCRAEATHKMWESHHCGRSLLLQTHKERAELFVEQFAGRGVPVTIEPA
jgi:ATP-dependent Clp protease adaptor protein ClpS